MQRIILALTIFTLLLTACGGGGDDTGANAEPTVTPIPTAPAAARPTYTVQRGTVQESLEFTGRWMPRDQAGLAFEINGTIRSVNVQRGDTVAAGDLLADYDTSDLENQLANAQLNLETAIYRLDTDSEGSAQSVLDAQFNLANAKLSLESAEGSLPWTNLESARIGLENAQNEIEDAQRTYDDLVSRPDSSATQVDSAWQRLRDAEISLQSAQNSYYSAAQNYNNQLISVEQQENTVIQREIALQDALLGTGADPDLIRDVQAAQLSVDQINQDIAQASLIAPFSGTVLEVTISPGDSVSAFTSVITLALPEPKEAIASLAFNDTQRLSVGMVGVCQVMNQPDSAVQCAVRQIPLSSRDADQTVRVAAGLENVTLGQVIEIEMPLEVRENVLWLPPEAIRTFQNRTYVVLDTPDGQQVSDVELGLETDDRVEIISGVQEGDVVVGP